MEKIKLAYQDYYLGQHTQSGYTFQNAVDKMFGARVATVTEGNGVYTVRFKNGREYTYNAVTGTTEKVVKWVDNGDNTFTNSETGTKVQLCDIVNYDELSNGAKSYTTDITKGIGGSCSYNTTTKKYDFTSKTYTTEDLMWRVLGINESGQIELISTNPMSESSAVCLGGEAGYLYGPEELNKMCNELYGRGFGASFSRSLSLEDIDKKAGITTEADKKAVDNNYGIKYQYRYPTASEVSGIRYMQYRKNSGSEYDNWTNITNDSSQRLRIPGADVNTELNSSNPGYSQEFMNDIYSYSIKNKVTQVSVHGIILWDLILYGTGSRFKDQWLANRAIGASMYGPSFRVRCIFNGDLVPSTNAFFVYGEENGYSSLRIRPIVTLNSKVELSGNSTTGWTIVQN